MDQLQPEDRSRPESDDSRRTAALFGDLLAEAREVSRAVTERIRQTMDGLPDRSPNQ